MAKKKAAPTTAAPVDAIRHQDKRTNIPTAEQSPMVDDAAPLIRYPRDPSLDPQLVWKTKDEQDAKDLEVPAVPIYIQEKIHPQAIIDDLRRQARHGEPRQAELFGDFDRLDASKRLEFYQHAQRWANRLILGDSLLVMNSLAEKERLKGKVQTIYMDPPYGIKFGSNWQVSTRRRDVKDGKAEDLTRQPEQIKAFRDTYELGIHSYLTYIRDRLAVARELLTESGSFFFQIGDENVHLVRSLMDEVFGNANYVATITFKTSIGLGSEYIDRVCDHIIWFAKSKEALKYRPLFQLLQRGERGATRYNYAELPDGTMRSIGSNLEEEDKLPQWTRFFTDQGLTSRRTGSDAERYTFEFNGKPFRPTAGTWRTTRTGMDRLELANRILIAGTQIRYKKYFDDFGAISLTNFWEDVGGGIQSRSDPKIYVVQTNTTIVQRGAFPKSDGKGDPSIG